MTHGKSEIAVIGAGIVGLCVGRWIQKLSGQVTVIDPEPVGSGASYGNSGLISFDTSLPMAQPGLLRRLPHLLARRSGPVQIRKGYTVGAVLWMLRCWRASRPQRFMAAAKALRALHQDAFADYRELLGDAVFSRLFRTNGLLQVWETEHESPADATATRLCREFGAQSTALSPADLRDLMPDLAPSVKRGLYYTRSGHVLNPHRLCHHLAVDLEGHGGVIARERVARIVPKSGDGLILEMEGGRQMSARLVVVAAGAKSKSLLGPLGIPIPLEAERGYHVMLDGPSLTLPFPVVNKSRNTVATPMEEGLRLTGFSDLGGLDAAPDERRISRLLVNAAATFPTLAWGGQRSWSGFRPSLPDSLPVLGPALQVPGLFLATGHGHFGLIGAATSARLIAPCVLGQAPSPDLAPYSVSRV